MENTEPQVVEEQVEQPVVENTEPEVELQSDREPEKTIDDYKSEYEKLQQEFEELKKKNESAEDVAKRLKDEKSQKNRAESEAERQAETEAKKTEFMSKTIEEAIESGSLSEEALSQAEEYGLTPAELELAMYKSKESINNLYQQAGGKDNYYTMVDTVKEAVTEQEVSLFKSALQDPSMAPLAMLALKQKYTELTGGRNVNTDNRIVNKIPTGAKSNGYSSMHDYQADMRQMRSMPTSQQAAYKAKIDAKVNQSDPKVLGLR